MSARQLLTLLQVTASYCKILQGIFTKGDWSHRYRCWFRVLKSSSSREVGTGVSKTVASCTARYCKESSQRGIGLIDTDAGSVFCHQHPFLDTGIIFHPSIAIAPRPNPPSVVTTAKQNVAVSSNERPIDGMSALRMLAATDSHHRDGG